MAFAGTLVFISHVRHVFPHTKNMNREEYVTFLIINKRYDYQVNTKRLIRHCMYRGNSELLILTVLPNIERGLRAAGVGRRSKNVVLRI